jgi:2-keto-4-pentenoate hydratase
MQPILQAFSQGPTMSRDSLAPDLGVLLAEARASGTLVPTPSAALLIRAEEAYNVQHAMLSRLGKRIAGWKIGAKSVDGPIQCAPLPEGAVRPQPGTVRRAAHPILGLELELAFRLGTAFHPQAESYASEEILGSIKAVAAAVEVVSSRFADWPKVDRLLQLADLQNHGALIVGSEVPYDAAFHFLTPTAKFHFKGESLFNFEASNPAGDPRRLLPWLVNHARGRGLSVTPEMWLTTGSYTGIYFPQGIGTAIGKFDGIPEVRLEIE